MLATVLVGNASEFEVLHRLHRRLREHAFVENGASFAMVVTSLVSSYITDESPCTASQKSTTRKPQKECL